MSEPTQNYRHHDHERNERESRGRGQGLVRSAFKIHEPPEKDQWYSEDGHPVHGLTERRDHTLGPAKVGGGNAMGTDELAQELQRQNQRGQRANGLADGHVQ